MITARTNRPFPGGRGTRSAQIPRRPCPPLDQQGQQGRVSRVRVRGGRVSRGGRVLRGRRASIRRLWSKEPPISVLPPGRPMRPVPWMRSVLTSRLAAGRRGLFGDRRMSRKALTLRARAPVDSRSTPKRPLGPAGSPVLAESGLVGPPDPMRSPDRMGPLGLVWLLGLVVLVRPSGLRRPGPRRCLGPGGLRPLNPVRSSGPVESPVPEGRPVAR
jgi:hypothetical protein